MKKIIYIANARIPTEKAHGIQIMKMCEAFAMAGADVELVVPRRKNTITSDPFTYYGVERNFRITYLSCPDTVRFGRVGFYVHWTLFSTLVFFHELFTKADIFYSRDELSVFFLSFFKKTALEIHDIPESLFFLYKLFVKRVSFIVSTNHWKKNKITRQIGVPEGRIIVCQNGFDPKGFKNLPNKKEIRQRLKLPDNKKLVLYVGHLYDWKGVDILAKATENLGEGIEVVFVGGTEWEINDFKKRCFENNILLVGQIPHANVPQYLVAADVLVLPNIPINNESRFGTSPIKMFEYMASGVPIVASDIPSVREILNSSNALLVPPGDANVLADGIKKILGDGTFADNIARRAKGDIQQYTWTVRAKHILQFTTNVNTK